MHRLDPRIFRRHELAVDIGDPAGEGRRHAAIGGDGRIERNRAAIGHHRFERQRRLQPALAVVDRRQRPAVTSPLSTARARHLIVARRRGRLFDVEIASELELEASDDEGSEEDGSEAGRPWPWQRGGAPSRPAGSLEAALLDDGSIDDAISLEVTEVSGRSRGTRHFRRVLRQRQAPASTNPRAAKTRTVRRCMGRNAWPCLPVASILPRHCPAGAGSCEGERG